MSKTLWTWCTGGTSSTVSPRSWSLHVHRNAHQPECKRSSVAHVNEEQIRKNHPKISKTLILPLYNIIYIYIYIYPLYPHPKKSKHLQILFFGISKDMFRCDSCRPSHGHHRILPRHLNRLSDGLGWVLWKQMELVPLLTTQLQGYIGLLAYIPAPWILWVLDIYGWWWFLPSGTNIYICQNANHSRCPPGHNRTVFSPEHKLSCECGFLLEHPG